MIITMVITIKYKNNKNSYINDSHDDDDNNNRDNDVVVMMQDRLLSYL